MPLGRRRQLRPARRWRWESAHFTYATRASDISVCPDILESLEENFALLQSYLGFDWPPGVKITYEKMAGQADYQAHGGCSLPGRDACTIESTVISVEAFHLHELVHAALWQTGFPPLALVEGVAVVLSCGAAQFASQKPSLTWDQLASLDYNSGSMEEVYAAGTWLVGYLLRHFDPRLFTSVYARLPSDADAGTMDAAFRDVYGQSLESIWAAALAESQPADVCLWQCSRPPLPLDGTPVATAGVCGTVDLFHPFTLASAAPVALTSTAAALQLHACNDRTALPDEWAGPGVLGLYDLPPGSYFVESSADAGTVTAEGSLPSLLVPTCAEATNLAPFAGLSGFRLIGPNTGGPQWYLPLLPPPAGTSLLSVTGGEALPALCASCDPAAAPTKSRAGPGRRARR